MNLLKTGFLWLLERRLFLNNLIILETLIFHFLMLMNIWQFHLLAWQGVGCGWAIFISFIYTELLVWAFSQSYSLNLTYCLKSSLLHAFCFLLVSMVDQTQMCPSSILSLGLFQGIICNIERLKGGSWSPELLGGPVLGEYQTPLHTMLMWYYLYFVFKALFTNNLWLPRIELATYGSNMY